MNSIEKVTVPTDWNRHFFSVCAISIQNFSYSNWEFSFA